MQTDKLFTGQREMAGLGIYHYGARFYSPKLGRFLSPDTIVPGYANPQAFNRYSYVLNMPISATDPTGHKCVGEAGECQTPSGRAINGTGSKANTAKFPAPIVGSSKAGSVKGSGGNSKSGSSTRYSMPTSGYQLPGGYTPAPGYQLPGGYTPAPGYQLPGGHTPAPGYQLPGGYTPVSGGPWINIYVEIDPGDIWQIFTEDPKDILMPGGNPVGTQQGDDPKIRTVPEEELNDIFNSLIVDAQPFTPKNPYPGQMYKLPDGDTVGSRNSKDHGPTLDIQIPDIPIKKIHVPSV